MPRRRFASELFWATMYAGYGTLKFVVLTAGVHLRKRRA